MSFREILYQECHGLLQIDLSDEQLNSFEKYLMLLNDWNEKISLTAIKSEQDILKKHFLDSLYCLKVIQTSNQKITDIGTGAGFPGLPLRIIDPTIELILVESVQKKTKFLNLVVQELGLEKVKVIPSRAEEIAHFEEFRETQDWVVARAVANLSTLVEYMLPLTKVGGKVLAQKSGNVDEEINQAEYALTILGGRIVEKYDYQLPRVTDVRSLIVIEKIKSTDQKYPRRVGIPQKRPL